ncbi:12459_t:CDS:2 [Funneliformis geosporum]|nr:12459_t:CDS:2 [Funneliformis geosporum]
MENAQKYINQKFLTKEEKQNLTELDLSENLYLGNDIEERIEKGIINRFHGFLKPLKNFPKLKELQVEGTDIHLLDNLKIISKEEAEKLRRTNRDNFSVILNDILINYAKKELGLDLTAEQEGEMEKLGSDIATSAQAKNVRLEEKIQGSEDKDGKTELTSTSITVAGGALTLLDYSTTGGVITLVAPLIGSGASQLKADYYDAKKVK